jgi:hypothetical protein
MKNLFIIAQFIPIVVLFLLLRYSRSFVEFSFTVLGKLAAIFIILFYTNIDILVGICVCGLVVLYYQSDYVENMLNIEDIVIMEDIGNLPDIDIPDNIPEFDFVGLPMDYDMEVNQNTQFEDDGIYLLPIDQRLKKTRFTKEKIRRTKKEKGKIREKMSDQTSAITNFRKENCISSNGYGELKYKGIPVRKDMIEHVFPEIKFADGPCNPCSASCKFSIIEQKMRTEEKMIPISTLE